MTCTFFGHRDTPQDVQAKIEQVLIEIIESKQADTFYVGHQGNFDALVRKTLQSLKSRYPHIRYFVVLAYLPTKKNVSDYEDYTDTIYPEGLEKTPRKFAINERNQWLIDHADMVITYVLYAGGAAKFKEKAEKQGKTVINLA